MTNSRPIWVFLTAAVAFPMRCPAPVERQQGQAESGNRAGPGLAALESEHQPDRNFLWKMVDHCLENSGQSNNYCSECPKPLVTLMRECTAASSEWDPVTFCKKTTEVWDKTSAFVAVKDYKMCGCADKNFIHGLALPRARVTGIEDTEHHPNGLWEFAWDEAVKKIGARESVALVANPHTQRSQDQLHIHLVRLAEGARKKLHGLTPKHIKSLDQVWTAAAEHAAAAGLSRRAYGIAVAYEPDSGEFLVAASARSPEELFTVYRCSP